MKFMLFGSLYNAEQACIHVHVNAQVLGIKVTLQASLPLLPPAWQLEMQYLGDW